MGTKNRSQGSCLMAGRVEGQNQKQLNHSAKMIHSTGPIQRNLDLLTQHKEKSPFDWKQYILD